MDQLQNLNPVIQMLVVMTLFSLLPFVFCSMTSFLRFVIVFSMLKTQKKVRRIKKMLTFASVLINE